MNKENIYEYVLGQKQTIEMECLKINTLLQKNDIFPDNIVQLIEQISQEHKNKQDTLEKLEEEYAEKKKEAEKKNALKKPQVSKLFLTYDDIINMIGSFSDGVYGVINYLPVTNTINADKANDLIIKYINDKKIEYYNKPAIVKKLINKNKFTESANEDSYGFVFLYEKIDDDITELNKVYLLKNGDINFINKSEDESNNEDSDNENNDSANSANNSPNNLANDLADSDNEDNKSESNSADSDKIITKIYHFVSEKKIVLKEIIYESNFESMEEEIDESSYKNKEKEEKQKLEEDIKNLNTQRKEYESFGKIVKKYKKHINDTIKSEDIRETFNNWTNIKTLIKKISDPTKCILDINAFTKFDWTNKFNDVKISNRYDEPEYSNLIKKYFDDNIEHIITNLMDIYDLNGLFKQYMYVFIEILLRAYIDEHLSNQSYCFNRDLCLYLKLDSIMPEPDTKKQALKKQYWKNALESSDNKRIVISLLNILNKKTQTIDQTLKYLSSLEITTLSQQQTI